jgi:SSS family transporter
MLTWVDLTVIVVYLAAVLLFGLAVSGKQSSTRDYFLGSRDLPWWAVCFSIVATETSTLTVIGIPAVSYLGSFTFLQITFGYLIGRTIVSLIFLNRYYAGNLETAYAFLGNRYGQTLRSTASVTFLLTRLLADGVRLFATAIPLKVVAMAAGLSMSYTQIIVLIGIATILYTYAGGIKAVVWVDVVQMIIYVGGALGVLVVLLQEVPADWWATAAAAQKLNFIEFGFDLTFSEWITRPYTFITAVVGGMALTMASHGTDQLIVQRLLACRSLGDSRKALIGSALVVMLQFFLFLMVGLLLWITYDGAGLEMLGLTRGDEIFPMYIIEGLPPGVSGFILAGIVAAAMSTLSSSLNSLASSSVLDLVSKYVSTPLTEEGSLRISRYSTIVWGVVFMGFASMFESQDNPVIELGLSIASFTYGGLLGVFLLGLVSRSSREIDAMIAFFTALFVMAGVIFGLWYDPGVGWFVTFQPPGGGEDLSSVAWPWYTVIGSLVTIGVGSFLTTLRRNGSDSGQ